MTDDLIHIEVASIYGAQAQAGLVELTIEQTKVQLPLEKARWLVATLQGAIEASISDELLWKFFTERLGVPPEKVAQVLLDFRELRQGTRGTSYPQ